MQGLTAVINLHRSGFTTLFFSSYLSFCQFSKSGSIVILIQAVFNFLTSIKCLPHCKQFQSHSEGCLAAFNGLLSTMFDFTRNLLHDRKLLYDTNQEEGHHPSAANSLKALCFVVITDRRSTVEKGCLKSHFEKCFSSSVKLKRKLKTQITSGEEGKVKHHPWKC